MRWSGTCLAGLSGALTFMATTIIGGALNPDYDHISQFISELYAANAPHADVLRFGGYIPSGLLIAFFSFSALRQVPTSANARTGFVGLGILYGAFTVLVSIFNCDEGCNKGWVDPSMSQIIHNTAGLLTYLTVPLCLVVLGKEARKWPGSGWLPGWGIASASISASLVVILFLNPASAHAGLVQRIIELSILSWIMACAYYLRNRIIYEHH
jgi:hypothetical protein